jgi:hypothetical protein
LETKLHYSANSANILESELPNYTTAALLAMVVKTTIANMLALLATFSKVNCTKLVPNISQKSGPELN